MNNERMFSKEDLDTATKITQIDSNVSTLKEEFKEFRTIIAKFSELIPVIRNDINKASTVAQDAKLTGDKHELRITALELKNTEKTNQTIGKTSIWKTYLALVGAIVLTTTAIIGIITIFNLLRK